MRVALAVVLSLMGMASCGGSGSSTTKSSPTGDKAAAARIVLKQGDFPSGWSGKPHAADPSQGATTKELGQCLGIGDVAARTTADVNSQDFSKGQGATVTSEARFVQSDAQASDDLAGFQGDKASGCLEQAMHSLTEQRLPSGLTPGNLSVQQLQFPTLKDGTAAHQASFTIPVGDTNVPVYVDFIVFRAGRAEVTLATTNLASPFDSKLEQSLAEKMASRA